jgi:hypothetical protein
MFPRSNLQGRARKGSRCSAICTAVEASSFSKSETFVGSRILETVCGTTNRGRDCPVMHLADRCLIEMETSMKRLKLLSAVALLTAIVPLTASSSSLAAGRGPGPCTPSGDYAVGSAGPALSGGQLMAGVGQCRSLDHSRYYGVRGDGYYGANYGYYGAPGWGATGFAPDYDY